MEPVEIRFVIDDHAIRAETVGLAKAELRWEMIKRALVAKNVLLLFLTPRQYQYIPLDEGLAADDRERVLALVDEKVGRVQRV